MQHFSQIVPGGCTLVLFIFLGFISSIHSLHKIYNGEEHIPQVVNAHMLTMLNNTNFNLRSVNVRSLLSTMALFTPIHISLPSTVINVMTFSNR